MNTKLITVVILAASLVACCPKSQAQTYTLTTIHTFAARSDGTIPNGAIVLDNSGNLYGTTIQGGSFYTGLGVIWKLNTATQQETILYTFNNEGASYGGLIADSALNLYGTASTGDDACYDGNSGGAIFEYSSSGVYKVLYEFGSNSGDGCDPVGSLTEDSGGNLYGTTALGGNFSGNCSGFGCGTVFEYITSEKKLVYLYQFAPSDNTAYPQGNVLLDSSGNVYTLTSNALVQITKAGQLNILYSWADNVFLGDYVTQDSQGDFIGTSYIGELSGGANEEEIWKLTPSGSFSVFVIQCSGSCPNYEPRNDYSPISIMGGKLYGSMQAGGSDDAGLVYDFAFSGNQFNALNNFTFAGGNGYSPSSNLVEDSSGNLYGTTQYGGESEEATGTVFQLSPN